MYRCYKCGKYSDGYYCVACGVTVEDFNKELQAISDKNFLSESKIDAIVNCILNLPMPKDEETLFDFLAMAKARKSQDFSNKPSNDRYNSRSSHSYYTRRGEGDWSRVNQAWETKYKELYYKAKTCYPNSPKFRNFNNINGQQNSQNPRPASVTKTSTTAKRKHKRGSVSLKKLLGLVCAGLIVIGILALIAQSLL